MSWLYRLLRPLLFSIDAETAHTLVGAGLRLWARVFPRPELPPGTLSTRIFGLDFPSPCGLAAGMDKGQVLAPAFFRLGFGFVEIGTVTPRPQRGNPRPRLFRLTRERALINRMGFNNPGAQKVAERLRRLPPQPGPVGVNIGRNRETPNTEAAHDYLSAFRSLAPYADYAALNVSSPNTPGLRALQAADELFALVAAVADEREELQRNSGRRIPILVKVSPDEPYDRLDALADAAVAAGADGFIATNTTLSGEGIADGPGAAEAGGLSGAPLREAAERTCARLFVRTEGQSPIIGVGGIGTAEDAYARIRAGASLVQVYTALVYDGPEVARRIHAGLVRLLARDDLTLAEAVGRDAAAIALGRPRAAREVEEPPASAPPKAS